LLDSPERSGPGQLNYNQPKAMGPKVSVLNIMGTEDGLIPYEGGESAVFGGDDAFQLMSAIGSMEVWAAHNGCDVQPTISTHTSDMGEVQKYVYNNCAGGTIVEHYAIEGAGHNAGGASIDNVKIDYDLMFGFINTIGETQPSSPAPSTDCEDDPNWSGKFNAAHNCGYVAELPTIRCSFEDANGVSAMVACQATCDSSCSISNPSPTSTPTQLAPIDCEDDPNWSGKFNAAHNCGYVAELPTIRCSFEDANGVSAMVACKLACSEDCSA